MRIRDADIKHACSLWLTREPCSPPSYNSVQLQRLRWCGWMSGFPWVYGARATPLPRQRACSLSKIMLALFVPHPSWFAYSPDSIKQIACPPPRQKLRKPRFSAHADKQRNQGSYRPSQCGRYSGSSKSRIWATMSAKCQKKSGCRQVDDAVRIFSRSGEKRFEARFLNGWRQRWYR